MTFREIVARFRTVLFFLGIAMIVCSAALRFMAQPASVPAKYALVDGASPASEGPLKIENRELDSLAMWLFASGALIALIGGFRQYRPSTLD